MSLPKFIIAEERSILGLLTRENFTLRGCVNPTSSLTLASSGSFTQTLEEKYAIQSSIMGPKHSSNLKYGWAISRQSSSERFGQTDKKVDFITILFVSTVRVSYSAVQWEREREREREPFPSRLNGPRLYLLTISWERERIAAKSMGERERWLSKLELDWDTEHFWGSPNCLPLAPLMGSFCICGNFHVSMSKPM